MFTFKTYDRVCLDLEDKCDLKTIRTATSKSAWTPSLVLAEHSRYLSMPTDFESSKATFDSTIPFFSNRKSVFVPTKMIGVFGSCERISGTHLRFTFSKDDIESME